MGSTNPTAESPDKATISIWRGGKGFELETYGLYFQIFEKGTSKRLLPCGFSTVEGTQLQLWEDGENLRAMRPQLFLIDLTGALCHATSGLAVDIVDDVPVLRCRRPVSGGPNPWSHPLPLFSFENSQIRIKFLSDPSLASFTYDLYPNDSWATKDFVLAMRTKKDFHMHPISDFVAWIPPCRFHITWVQITSRGGEYWWRRELRISVATGRPGRSSQ